MNKIFLLSIIAVLSISAQAQDDISFGVKGGVNFASLTGDDADDLDGRTSFHIGVLVEIPISDEFSIQPELLYSQQGSQVTDSFDGITIDNRLNLDYINLPIVGKYYVAENFSLEAGTQFGFNISAESVFDVSSDVIGGLADDGESEDVSDQISSFDLGAVVGAGYKLEGGLFFQARYVFGFSSVDDAGDTDITNANIQLSAGYRF